MATNTEFEFLGINHLAPTCRDMQETIDFYSGILGMPVVCTNQAGPDGQVFFFDLGGGSCLAFMWSPDYPEAVPGVASPEGFLEDMHIARAAGASNEELMALGRLSGKGTAHGALNHIALNVAPEKIEEYHAKLVAKGVRVSPIINHAQEPTDPKCDYIPNTEVGDPRLFMRSIYFRDPNGIQLEIACWNRAMTPTEASLPPATAASKREPAAANS